MRVLVCGSRTYDAYGIMERRLEMIPPPVVIIEGEAKGADIMARRIAVRLGYVVVRFPANWGRYGNRAGPIRNQQMLDDGRPDRVLAFCDERLTPGTKDMVDRARKAGVPTEVYTIDRGRKVD